LGGYQAGETAGERWRARQSKLKPPEVAGQLVQTPKAFTSSQIGKTLGSAAEMASGEQPLDWATAEALAIASLAWKGMPSASPARTASAGLSAAALRLA